MKISIKKVHPSAKIPTYAHTTDAGCDLFLLKHVVLQPGKRFAAGTGIAMAIPEGYVGLIWDKSGLAASLGIKTMGGVIDSGYRGEIKVVLLNTQEEEIILEPGQKIAQLLVQPINQPRFEIVENLEDSDRGEGGFGSTGVV